jgi:hypothetical protein
VPHAAAAQQFNELADGAARDHMSYRAFLAEPLMAERDDRARRRSERRIGASGFPREKSLRTLVFNAGSHDHPATQPPSHRQHPRDL